MLRSPPLRDRVVAELRSALRQLLLPRILLRHLEAPLLSVFVQFLPGRILFPSHIPLLLLPVRLGSQRYPAQPL